MNQDLVALRISVARIAQAAGVDNHLAVSGLNYGELATLANERERGWNDLAGRVVEAFAAQGWKHE